MEILIPFWVPNEVIEKISDEFQLIYPKNKNNREMSMEEIKQILPRVEGVMVGHEIYDQKMIDIGQNLRAIGRLGVGYDNIDYQYAGSKGIAVINTPIAVQQPTSELTIAIMLSAARCIVSLDKKIRLEKKMVSLPVFSKEATTLYGKTLGIIGFGRIGKIVGAKCHGLGMKIIYSDLISASHNFEKEIKAKHVSTEELLREADFVTIHCPYTPENHHLINEKTLKIMKPSSYLINASRGKMVDEKALVDALRKKIIAGAALDVYEFEPEINQELLGMENVVLVPHIGTWNYDARIEMILESLEGICKFLKGKMPENCVNKEYFK